MDADVQMALARDLVIELTTTGRTSGTPRTVEIWFHRLDGHYFISGWPGGRDWYVNLLSDPRFRIRFTQSGGIEVDAIAHPITDPARRLEIFTALFDAGEGHGLGEFGAVVAGSPLIEFTEAT